MPRPWFFRAVAELFKGTLVPLDPLAPNDPTLLRSGIVWNGASHFSSSTDPLTNYRPQDD